MRALGFLGLAGAIALVPAGSPVAADSGRAASTMTMNAPATAGHGDWGGVPNAPLNPPSPQPGWGANGWHVGAPGGPMAGGPGPGGPPPGGMRPGGPGPMHPAGPAGPGRPGMWHGGGGHWQGQYRHVGRGYRLPRFWLSPDYYLSDWGRYGLWNPGYGQNWIRYYDDALLIDGSGRVIDGRYGLDWDRGGYDDGDDDYGYGGGGYDYGHGHGGYGDYRQGGVTIHRGPGTTVVVVQGQPSVTTTTTTTYETVGTYPHKRKWHKRTWKPACRCR